MLLVSSLLKLKKKQVLYFLLHERMVLCFENTIQVMTVINYQMGQLSQMQHTGDCCQYML